MGYVLRGPVLGQGFGGYIFRDYISDLFPGRTDCAEHQRRRNTSETVFGSSFFLKNGFKTHFRPCISPIFSCDSCVTLPFGSQNAPRYRDEFQTSHDKPSWRQIRSKNSPSPPTSIRSIITIMLTYNHRGEDIKRSARHPPDPWRGRADSQKYWTDLLRHFCVDRVELLVHTQIVINASESDHVFSFLWFQLVRLLKERQRFAKHRFSLGFLRLILILVVQ